jgi:phosphonate transport system permease protein
VLPTITAAEIRAARQAIPAAFAPPPGARPRLAVAWTALAAVLAVSVWRMEVTPGRLLAGLGKLGWLVRLMLPPAHHGWLGEFAYALLETVAMALLGTVLAAIVAVPLGFLGARNVVPQWLFHFGLRRGFDGLRAIDSLIWALMFVHAVGLGPFAGVLAIAAADIGVLAKLFAEAIENVDRGPVDGVRAAGGNRAQEVGFAILPQVQPVMLSNVLYYFESNVRSATILGVVGAGGIGFQLAERIRINHWDEVAFIVLMILVTVAVIDWLSTIARLRIVRGAAVAPTVGG